MTIDDEKSLYVGGLPYNATGGTVRKAFELYGHVIAVKIVNERGKCYGFVTFRNPRSVIDAVGDMNGRTIDGRRVKVDEVKNRGGRLNSANDTFRHNTERGIDRNQGRDRERHYDRNTCRDRHRERSVDHGQDRDKGSSVNYRHCRKIVSESSADNNDQVGKQLDISNQKLGELQKEISQMEELVKEKGELFLKLQEKNKNLEYALSITEKLTSHHQMQLTKLHKCYLHMKEYSERLRNLEQELQSLVDSTMIEIGTGDDVGVRNGVLANGNA